VGRLRSMNDGKHYTRLVGDAENGQHIVRFAYQNGEATDTLFSASDLSEVAPDIRLSDYRFSDQEDFLLLLSDPIPIYRRSRKVRAHLYNLESEKAFTINEGRHVLSPSMSPSGRKVAFVDSNNLYYQDFYPTQKRQVVIDTARTERRELEAGVKYAITEDGKKNHIINGQADWVYEEEFSLVKAYQWSPDGKFIAYFKFDESEVPLYRLKNYKGQPYPDTYSYKYPKAGEDPSFVSTHIYGISNGRTRDLELKHDSTDYLPRLRWTTVPNQLVVHRINRAQNKLDLFFINALNGDREIRYTEKNRYYINLNDDLFFLENGDFILRSEKNVYSQIYMYTNEGQFKNQITSGRDDVTDILHVNDEENELYYTTAEVSPIERHIYKSPFSGRRREIERWTTQAGTHDAQFSATAEYYVHTYSSATRPPVSTIRKTGDTTALATLVDNKALQKKWRSLDFAPKQFFEMDGARGDDYNGYLIKPKSTGLFKKLPLLIFVYGGPGSQMVRNKWSSYYDIYFHYLANEKDIAVACIDGRGTGAKGDRFEKSIYRELGQKESEDQAEAVAFLEEEFGFLNTDKVGIFGWSYGGYLASMCLMKYPDVFDCGVAVAPVTDWRFYDNIYTERYMDQPRKNKEGYKEASLLNKAQNLEDEYLLVHGTFDDNVHPQNSFELSKLLNDMGIQHDTAFYINKDHGIYGGLTRLQLFTQITNFLEKNLQ
jgi:dipeptidyl-peptidase-4